MQLICANAAAMAVAVIFYSWRTYFQAQLRRQGVLHTRVAYLLWVVAERVGKQQKSLAVD